MTTFDWLGNQRDETALLGALAEACERLADVMPDRCEPDPAWQSLIDDLEAQGDS
jgi:hypothetical protein